MTAEKHVSFQIDGEFVCDLARVWFWDEGREYAKCEELLLSCLVTDQITLEEKKKIVVEILEGRKKLVGVNHVSLVDDNARIRPLADKIEEYRKKEIIRKIEEDIQRRPLAYMDPYSCEQNPADYRPISDDLNYEDKTDVFDAFGKFLTPYEELRLWAYSVSNFFSTKRRVLPGFWNESDRPYLDQGLYLLARPALGYELIGGPGKDTDKLLLLLRDHLQSLVNNKKVNQAAALEIIHRNKKYEAAQEKKAQEESRRQIPEPEAKGLTEDELNKRTDPDDFLSEYGLIDPSGNYYSCKFAGHHVKAYYILAKRERVNPDTDIFHLNFDEALDKLYSEGWVLIRNPDPRGSVFFDFRGDRRPTKKQIDAAFSHMIKFDEPTLRGIEKYLED